MIAEALDALSHVRDIPREAWSVVGGIAAGFGLTQRIRALLPDAWDDKTHEVASQALVFIVAYAVTFFTWGGKGDDANAAALVTALMTPALWNMLLVAIGWWKPSLRDALVARPTSK